MPIKSRARVKARREDHLKAMIDSVNSTSAMISVLHIAFLLFCSYVLVAVFSTTDTDLIMGKSVKLAFVNADVSLIGFYLLAPSVLVVLHFNLWLQIYLLSAKIRATRKLLQPADIDRNWTDRLHTFPFTIFLFGRTDHVTHRLVAIIAAITLLLLPFIVLISAQTRLLAYQEQSVTWIHRGLIWIDVSLAFLMWRLSTLSGTKRCKLDGQQKFQLLILWGALAAALFTQSPFTLLASLIAGSIVGIWIYTSRNAKLGSEELSANIGLLYFLFLGWTLPIALTIDGEALDQLHLHDFPSERVLAGAATIERRFFPESRPGYTVDRQWHALMWEGRFDYPANSGTILCAMIWPLRHLEVIGAHLLQEKPTAAVTEKLNSADRAVAWEARRLVNGVFLEGRNLRRANLQGSNLINAELSGADLRGAALGSALLGGAKLLYAKMADAKFVGTRMEGANLRNAKMKGALFGQADLSGASLRNADLRGVVMHASRAVGVDFGDAWLAGAEFNESNLFEADFAGAYLRGANFGDEVDLRFANFNNADLTGADFSTAVLSNATFKRSYLSWTSFRNADLREIGTIDARASDHIDARGAVRGGANWVGYRRFRENKPVEQLKKEPHLEDISRKYDAEAFDNPKNLKFDSCFKENILENFEIECGRVWRENEIRETKEFSERLKIKLVNLACVDGSASIPSDWSVDRDRIPKPLYSTNGVMMRDRNGELGVTAILAAAIGKPNECPGVSEVSGLNRSRLDLWFQRSSRK